MPADREAEQALLAVCITSQVARTIAKGRVTARDFDAPEHEAIWDAMSRLERHGKDVGWITVNHVLAGNARALAVMPDLVTSYALPDQVTDYADIVRDKATMRRLGQEARAILDAVDNPHVSGNGLAAKLVTRFAAIRDSGHTADDIAALTLDEILAKPDDPYDWIIEDLLERSDRLVLTGEEGLGKSHLLRQIAVFAAAGLHPFKHAHLEPVKATIIDCENTERQIRRAIRPVFDQAQRNGQDPGGRIVIDCCGRIDITADKELSRIHHLLDATMPDIVVIGPLYRLVPHGITNDDDAAPVLTALDSIRDRGIALLIEAHAGHGIGKGGTRDLRPRGSSALLGWPEFGYGMRATGEDTCELVPWRGDRDERKWPDDLRRHDQSARWIPMNGPEGIRA